MKVLDRIAVLAIFMDIWLLIFALGAAANASFEGLWAAAPYLLLYAPLLAMPLLIAGQVIKPGAVHDGLCRLGLGLMLLTLAVMAGSYGYTHGGLVHPLTGEGQIQSAWVVIGRDKVELAAAEEEQLIQLLQQVSCRNPYTSLGKWDYEAPQYPDHFGLITAAGLYRGFGVYPPCYVYYDSYMEAFISYEAADPELCRQLAELYNELAAKYAGADIQLAAAAAER